MSRRAVCVLGSVFSVLCCLGAPAAHERITTKVTWDREIAPIVEARCVSCHRPGGRAPMSLATYAEARPWAKAIKEEVLARRMPKWPVVRGYGDFTNDPSLSSFEIALLAAWADGGAPKPGDAKAPAAGPVNASATASAQPPATRDVRLPCTTKTLPAGTLVGLNPSLPKGGSLRLTLLGRDGDQPLLWIKNFDPEFAQTYWLRNPVTLTGFSRVRAESTDPCSLTTLLARGTDR